MKIRKIALSLVLVLFSFCSAFALVGCGGTSLKTLKESFDEMDAVYAQYSTVFKTGSCDGFATKYLIDYGTEVNNLVGNNEVGFKALRSKYNILLSISNDYIDKNKAFIISFKEEDLTKAAKKSIKKLNESVVEYTDYIDEFVKARNSFNEYWRVHGSTANKEAKEAYLREFKREFGALVEKNIEISTNLAKTIEETEIFDLLKAAQPTKDDTTIVKEYLRAKMLPIYSNFLITETETALNWDNTLYNGVQTKKDIDAVLETLSNNFEEYKTQFLGDATVQLTLDEMKAFLNLIDNFVIESGSYLRALKDLKISELATTYKYDMEKYLKENKFAEIYFQKIEQFINTTLPNFVEKVVEYIY